MIVRKKVSIVSPSAQKWIDNFPPPLLLSVPRDNGLVARKTGCPLTQNLIIINLATQSHSPHGPSLSVEYNFVSDPGPRNDQRPAGNLFANIDTKCGISNIFLLIVFISPYDVIEHRHEDNSSLELFGFAHVAHDFLNFADSLSCWESWENTPLEFHRFSVNCVQRSVLWWIFEPIQLSLPGSICCLVLIHLSKTGTQNLRIQKPLHSRNWWLLHYWPEVTVCMENFPSWFETLQKSHVIVRLSTFQICRTSVSKWDFSPVFLMECKLSE